MCGPTVCGPPELDLSQNSVYIGGCHSWNKVAVDYAHATSRPLFAVKDIRCKLTVLSDVFHGVASKS